MKEVQSLFDISGKVAVITGASSGLGMTFARGLAKAGVKVVLAARRESLLEGLVSDIRSDGREALALPCDVTDEEAVDRLAKETVDRFGGVDILVNNAGITKVVPIEEEAAEDFRRIVDVNLTGTFLCTQRFGRIMLESGKGSIINVASIMGLVGIGQIPHSSYSASKAAVVNFTREVAAQWARRGIRVNAIAPGYFPTEMTGDMFDDESGLKFIRRHTPMGRPGNPKELLGALIFLSSEASSYMTGQTLAVDGGWTII